MYTQPPAKTGILPDSELITRILQGEKDLYALIVRRYNQRLYRVGMGILDNDAEVEDAMQAMGRGFEREYIPDTSKAEIYNRRYAQYKKFGGCVESLTTKH